MNKLDKALESIGIIILTVIIALSFSFSIFSITEIKNLKTQQKYYEEEILYLWEDLAWEIKENEILENDIYWLKKLHQLELEHAKNNDLKERISELEEFIDNYEDLLEIYFRWLRDNPNGTQEEFEFYLFTYHRWIYDWATTK